ncbi:hypothetical protein E2C01_013941 [Portunus trituberculatus]|uniref:Uncharacterized protein n=1 Tax=Portunus trituberculatus TaxID=210409 RepID=A0A5B7DIP4_PORTR|nr:hypothetical protein [Portunus trituberculatus]
MHERRVPRPVCHIAVELWEAVEEAHHFQAVGNACAGQQAAAVLVTGVHIMALLQLIHALGRLVRNEQSEVWRDEPPPIDWLTYGEARQAVGRHRALVHAKDIWRSDVSGYEENGTRLGVGVNWARLRVREDGETSYRGESRSERRSKATRIRRDRACGCGRRRGELRGKSWEGRSNGGEKRHNRRRGKESRGWNRWRSWIYVGGVIPAATRLPGGRGGRNREPWELGAPCCRMDIVRALVWRYGDAGRSLWNVGEASWSLGSCVGENRSLGRCIGEN